MTAALQAQPDHPTSANMTPSGPIRINSDPVDWPRTPRPVADKLRRLRRERDDAWLVWRSISDEQREAWNVKRTAEAGLKTLTGARHNSTWFTPYLEASRLSDDHPSVVAELSRLENAKAEIERLDPVVAVRAHQFQQHGSLVASIERYFEAGLQRVKEITLHARAKPSLKKAESPLDAVERCRRRKRELDADHHRITCAPWPSAEAKRRARAEIEKLAERGQPSVHPLIESRHGSIGWGEQPFNDMMIGGRLLSGGGDPPTWPVLCWLHRDVLIQRMESEIDAISDDGNALTAEERATQIQEIEQDRLAVEREEEAWIIEAVEGGANILRRPDADPRAVLGLGDDMPALAN